MKTKTIDKILKKLNLIVEVIKNNNDKLNAYEEISRIEDLLNKDKVRKEEKKKIQEKGGSLHNYKDINKIQELEQEIGLFKNRIKTIETNSYNNGYKNGFEDAKRQDRFPIGIYWQSMYGFELTPTNKIVINDEKLFRTLLTKLNYEYSKQCKYVQGIDLDYDEFLRINLRKHGYLISKFNIKFDSFEFERQNNNKYKTSVNVDVEFID